MTLSALAMSVWVRRINSIKSDASVNPLDPFAELNVHFYVLGRKFDSLIGEAAQNHDSVPITESFGGEFFGSTFWNGKCLSDNVYLYQLLWAKFVSSCGPRLPC